MIVPVMAISNLVLAQQIYSEETNGAHAHYREPVPLIQPGERRRSTGHKIKSQIESEKYKPVWKCSKRFIPPQTDGMICFYSNIGCSESKVIFK